ncbi:MAG: hypothetical protein QGG88_11750 [Gammaproteobacteria bacterium]|jgi:hypothetical protein|nr:hypothetical protein [Gammaproteobacteria bacterium]
MSCTFLQRLNALIWLAYGLSMVIATEQVNNLMANQHPWLTGPLGWGLLIYGVWLLLAAFRVAVPMRTLQVLITFNYGWSLLIILLISTGQVIVAPMGIRVAMLMALLTAAMGALLFRHFKLLMGKY